jgi:universal stress protein A
MAQAPNVDLIVMSTQGYTGIQHILEGSIAERVVEHAPCPVVVVREREHEFLPIDPALAGKTV